MQIRWSAAAALPRAAPWGYAGRSIAGRPCDGRGEDRGGVGAIVDDHRHFGTGVPPKKSGGGGVGDAEWT